MEMIQVGVGIGAGIAISVILVGCALISVLAVIIYVLAIIDWFRK